MYSTRQIIELAESVYTDFETRNPYKIIAYEKHKIYEFTQDVNNRGFLVKLYGIHKLFVSANLLEEEKIYTLAHELGHYYLHGCDVELDTYYFDYYDMPTNPKLEYEADLFAAWLLIDTNLFFDYLRTHHYSLPYIAKIFCVPVYYAEYKYKMMLDINYFTNVNNKYMED